MKNIDNLDQIASRRLGGLEAGEVLWQKITLEASEAERPSRGRLWKTVAACAGAAAVAAACTVFFLNARQAKPETGSLLVQTLPAGESVTQAPPAGSMAVTMSAVSGGEGIFSAAGEEGLLLLSSAAYRLTDTVVPEKLLGEKIASVTEYTRQPSLSDGDAVSSVIPNGGEVFAVDQAKGAVAAKVEGDYRLLQRVSYLGRAARGGETLEDTLCRPEDAAAVSFGGRVFEGERAAELLRLLYSGAECLDAGCSGSGTLTVTLRNGLPLSVYAGDDTVSACGTWYCPEFFQALTGE